MRFSPFALLILLASLTPSISEAQEAAPPKALAKQAVPDHDPRFSSPRATVRTFLNAVTQANDVPGRIEDAEACLDLSSVADEPENGGNIAVQLEAVLRALGVATDLLPDKLNQRIFLFADQPDQYIALERQPNGNWRFDSRTVQMTPKMRNALRLGTLKGMTLAKSATASAPADIPSEFSSPREVFRTFVTSIHNHNTAMAVSCLDLTEISAPARQALGQALAVKLKEVIHRHALVLYQDLPESYDGDAFVWMAVDQGRVEVARQVSGHRKGQWLFTKDTVRQIESLYDFYKNKPVVREAEGFEEESGLGEFWSSPGLWVRKVVPDWLEKGIRFSPTCRIEIYQVCGLLLLVLLSVAVERIVAWMSMEAIEGLFTLQAFTFDEETAIERLRPVGWLASLAAAQFVVVLLDLRRDVANLLLSSLNLFYWIMAAVAFYRLIDIVADYARQRGGTHPKHTAMTEMLLPVTSLVLRATVVVVGLMVVLQLFELDIAAVLTGLGIGGLAFALAAQDTLKNFFGSFTLIADRTFFVGHFVKIGGREGTVESVGVRSTRIRTPDDSLLTIPNSELTTAHIANFGAQRFRRANFEIKLKYSTPIDRLIAFRDGVLELLKSHPNTRGSAEEASIHELSDSGIKLMVNIHFDVKDWHSELEAKQILVLGILRLAERLGVELAVPSHILRLESSEAQELPPLPPPSQADWARKPLSIPHPPHPSRFLGGV